MKSDHPNTSVYFTDKDKSLMADLQEWTGLKRTQVVREAITRMHSQMSTESDAGLIARRAQIQHIRDRLLAVTDELQTM